MQGRSGRTQSARAGRGLTSRRTLLAGAASAVPLLSTPHVLRAQTLDRLVFVTNWRAQAEHGGFYQAREAGLYRAAGLEVELRPGGPQINPTQLLLGGRADMAMSNGLEALSFVREDLPFLCIAAIFQKDMQVLLGHPGTLPDFAALKGRRILVGAQARVTWWPFLRAKYGLSDDQLRPYTFNLQPFLADKTLVQQGYLGSEPYSLEQAGVKPDTLLIDDAGFANYGTTINISRATLAAKRPVIQRFISATLTGWDQYLKGPAGGFDTSAANAAIRRDNSDMTDALIAYSTRAMNSAGIVRSGDALKLGIGAMTDAHWQGFFQANVTAGVLPAGLRWQQAFDLSLVNQGIGRA